MFKKGLQHWEEVVIIHSPYPYEFMMRNEVVFSFAFIIMYFNPEVFLVQCDERMMTQH